MQVISVLDNLNISPKLQSLKFMRGFSAAKSFLLQLKSIKQHQSIDKKPQNSLAFSPIAQHSSITSDHTNRQIGRADLITQRQSKASLCQRKGATNLMSRIQNPKQIGVEYLKNQVNISAKQLNQMHSELIFTEKAIQILAERLRYHARVFKKIQSMKHEERQKNIRLIALKSSVDKKRMALQQLSKTKEKFQIVLRSAIKTHFLDQYQNFKLQPITHFAKDISFRQAHQLQSIETKQYPEKLQLKFKTIKKRQKQKEKKKDEILTQQFIKEKDNEDKKKGNQPGKLPIEADTYYDSEFIDV